MKRVVTAGCALVGLLLFIASGPAYGQGAGLYVNEGIGIGGQISANDNVTQFGVTGSYAFSPLVEAGLSVSRTTNDLTNLNATGIGPYVGLYPVRQSEEVPVSVRIAGGVSYDRLGGDAIDQLESAGLSVDASSTNLTLSGSLIHEWETSSQFSVFPIAEAGVVRQSTEVSASALGQSESQTDTSTDTFFALGGSLLIQTEGSVAVAITPSLTFSNDTSTPGVSVTLISAP